MDTDLLRSTPLFETLTDAQRERVAERMKEREVALGEVLARQGGVAYHLFVVVEGIAVVTVDDELVTTLRRGNTFGEIAVIESGPRSANVVAVTPMRLLTLTVWEFNELADEIPDFGARAKALAQARLERTEK